MKEARKVIETCTANCVIRLTVESLGKHCGADIVLLHRNMRLCDYICDSTVVNAFVYVPCTCWISFLLIHI